MRKFLNSLPIASLIKIATDLGLPVHRKSGDPIPTAALIGSIVEYCQGYRLSKSDLIARYPNIYSMGQ